jgi:hypothetical protein
MFSTRCKTWRRSDVDNLQVVPMGCGRPAGDLTSPFGNFSPIHRAYYCYYRLLNKT